MDSEAPGLGVEFIIEPTYGGLIEAQRVMDSTEYKAVASAKKIEQAVSGMLNTGNGVAQITAVGNAASKTQQDLNRERARAERQGEALVRQLEREAAAMGKTKDEMRDAKVEILALANAQFKNIDLADRLAAASRKRQFAAEAAAEAEAKAAAAANAATFADRADKLRASIDPAAAAQQRFNREMAEARTLIAGGAISLDDYAAKLRMEQAALDASSAAHGRSTKGAAQMRAAMQGASYQVQDLLTQISMGANPINALAVQGGQLAGQFSNVENKAGAVAQFMIGPWGLAITAGLLVLGPLVSKLMEHNDALDDAVNKLKKDASQTELTRQAKERFQTTSEGVAAAIRDGSEATAKAIEAERTSAEQANIAARANLAREISIRGVTMALLDQAKAEATAANATNFGAAGGAGAGMAQSIYAGQVADLKKRIDEQQSLITLAQRRVQETRIGLAEEEAKRIADPLERIKRKYDEQAQAAKNAARAQIAAGGEVTDALARQLAQIEINRQAAIKAEQDKTKAVQERLRAETRETATAASVAAMLRQTMRGVQITSTTGGKHTAGSDHYKNRAIDFVPAGGMASMSKADVRAMFQQMGLPIRRNAAGVEQLFGPGDKGHSDHFHVAWEKGKEALDNYRASLRDGRAEQTAMARELTDAQVTEAQTKNLYALSDAYAASGGAALIAAARVKAEADAIRAKGDIEASVARDVGLAIAQRVADASQSTAVMRDQAAAQASVNAMVAAGTVPAERAAELVQAQLADLPLLGAIQAANATKNVDGANRATAALEAQRAARKRLADEERNARFNTAMAAGVDQLAGLREELRLVGATDEARARALVTLRATQEANRAFTDPAQRAAYIAQQLMIADLTAQLAAAQDVYNGSLTRTSELLDLIDQQASTIGDGLATAFGGFGDGIATALTALTGYAATQERIDQEHRDALRAAHGDQAAIAAAEIATMKKTQIARTHATMQAIGGVKSLFKEHSTAYKVMSGIEKAYAAWQAAQTIASIARDVAKTASHLVNSGVRTTANTAEGGSKIFAELGPFAFPVVAAMVGVLAALGARGGGSVSSGPSIPSSEDLQAGAGTGTVLGDSKAKSESIARSLEIVAANTNSDLQYSNDMLKTMRSIDNSIGRMAGSVARQVQVSGGMFDTTGQNLGTNGKAGFLGLFGGSTTTRSLYDLGMTLNSGSVADIIANGISGQT